MMFRGKRRPHDFVFLAGLSKRSGAGSFSGSSASTKWPPDKYTLDLDDYFSGMVSNEELDCNTRIRAAHEEGALNGMKTSRRYSMVLQLNSASKIALRRYAKIAARFNAR
jgi:hypothetical protein